MIPKKQFWPLFIMYGSLYGCWIGSEQIARSLSACLLTGVLSGCVGGYLFAAGMTSQRLYRMMQEWLPAVFPRR
ncbi:MAG: hypothetical protein ACYCW6_18360 [Candidatus Xenobia bacterium]